MPTAHSKNNNMVIGGAEKRFFSIWCHNCELRKNIFLVCSNELFEVLKSVKEFEKFDLEYFKLKWFVPYNFGGIRTYFKEIQNFKIVHNIKESDVFHFVLIAPMGFLSNKSIFSCVFSGLNIFNLSGKLTQIASVFFSKHSDVLDPIYTAKFKKWFFYKSKQITNTPNSFTDTLYYHPAPSKQNMFVFLGSLAPEKGILELLEAIPGINKRNEELGREKLKFKILGDGPLVETVKSLVKEYREENIDIEYKFSTNPVEYLSVSKVFFTLQRNTNYPSKSLIEAMSCGNMIIATDCGDTRRLAKQAFTEYIPEFFSKEDLIEACAKVIQLSESEFNAKSFLAREEIDRNHRIERVMDYYDKIYNKS